MRISELGTVIPGFSPKPNERKKHGKYLLAGGRNIQQGKLVKTDLDSYVDEIERGSFHRAIAKVGDIIVSTLFDRRKLYIYKLSDPHAVVNSSCAIIRSTQNNDYVVSYLRTLKGQQEFLEKASRATAGTFIPRLSIKDLSDIDVPILPIEEIERLGDASLESSTTDELLSLKTELESRNSEIERLKAQNKEMETYFLNRISAIESQIGKNDLKSRIQHGETSSLEFKSTLRWNLKKRGFDKEIENAVLKTILAFCNTNGGELLIGVSDNKEIIGLKHDDFDNEDKFQLHLRNLLNDRVKPNILQYVDYEIITVDGESICSVKCRQSNEAMWLKTDAEHFYVRSGPSSTELPPSDAVHYILTHFNKM